MSSPTSTPPSAGLPSGGSPPGPSTSPQPPTLPSGQQQQQPQILKPQPPPINGLPRQTPPIRQYYPHPAAHQNAAHAQQQNFYPPPQKSTKETPALAFAESAQQYNRRFQGILDRITPYSAYRWLGTAVLLFLFGLRVVLGQGWYIVAYGLSIFLLNIFLAFLQPRFDPSLDADLQEQDIEEGGEAGSQQGPRSDDLPTAGLGKKVLGLMGMNSSTLNADGEEEFKPFIRRLPEFKFWWQATRATLISLGLTTTRAADIPVFWPILVIYFITLFGLTMRRQLRHMIKYKYIPFDLGRKTTYGRK
ncbi:Golgi proteins involved in ER retention (RER) [Phaffia rhodozyma]|uniref:Golgi proteins involved in ER retention (RER) n=1 Tax=Phaffia rhodozyma TaxID=264483 RepID=A0A0F7SPA9_PHARH|nr:Golgi proteins involved in ER retention (RER) [Phaffia rhodozyma]